MDPGEKDLTGRWVEEVIKARAEEDTKVWQIRKVKRKARGTDIGGRRLGLGVEKRDGIGREMGEGVWSNRKARDRGT